MRNGEVSWWWRALGGFPARRPSLPGPRAAAAAPLAGLGAGVAEARAWGDGEDVLAFLSREELAGRVNVTGALGGLFAPHSARIQPASLVTGLAAAAERRDVVIYEATPVTEILPSMATGGPGAVARTIFGDVRARAVLRCTEGF